jgi:RND family efflux transporter MFP subunit
MKNLAFFAALPLALMLAGCSQQAEETAPPVRPVLSQVVESGRASAPQFVGIVTPRVTVTQAFRVGGTLVSRQVDVGSSVKAGEVVATLDATTSELALQTARANLTSAEAQYANAAAAESRLRTLNQSDVVSLANLEQAEQQTSGAQAALIQAQSRLSQAEEQLSYSTLTAPFDGIVTAVGAEPGSVVGASQTVVTIADPETRDLVIDLPETVISQVSIGTPFRISPQLSPGIEVEGKVREIAPQAHPVTRTWRIKIGVDSEADQFWLGTTATAILGIEDEGRLTVPETAIRKDGEETVVWVVDETAAVIHRRPVTVEAATSGIVSVTSGLEAGERIVIAGVNGLSDGQQIKLDQESAK